MSVPEVGSSGGALLDENDLLVGVLVGVLSGGVGTSCNNFEWDEFAKLHPRWASLQPFLDPDDTGVPSLPGKDHADVPGVPAASAWVRVLLVGPLMARAGRAIRRPNGRAADSRTG